MQNKNKWKKRVILLFTCFFLLFGFSGISRAEPSADNPDVNVEAPTDDTDVIYERYKDNSFELMTKEGRGIVASISAGIKSFFWSGVVGIGKFNAEMVRFMFGLDIVTPVKEPIQSLTAGIAKNMTSLASTIGICIVALVMLLKYFGEQRYKQIFRVFFMTIAIFTGLSILSDGRANDTAFTKLMDIDSAVEAKFVSINPVFGGNSIEDKDKNEASASDKLKASADLIASRIYRSNVYEPYLLMQYGTSNVEKIREKTVKYKNADYDRIGILLDNDIAEGDNEKIFESVVNYESKDLKNKNIHYSKSFEVAGFSLFYMVINLIQMVIFFILALLRIILAFLQLMLWPLLPILLLVGLFNFESNVFVNYGKAFGLTIFMKSMTGVACIIFAMYVTFGFQVSSSVENPYHKMLTILVYVIAPIGIYVFRFIIAAMFTGRMNMRMVGHALANPMKTNRLLQNESKERANEAKERRKKAKADRKSEAEKDDPNGDSKKENEPKAPKSTKSKRSNHRNGDTKKGNINEPQNNKAEDKDRVDKTPEDGKEKSENMNQSQGKGHQTRKRSPLRGGQVPGDSKDGTKNNEQQSNTPVSPKSRRRNMSNNTEDKSQNDTSIPIYAKGELVAGKEKNTPNSMPQSRTNLNPKSRRRKMGSKVSNPQRAEQADVTSGNQAESSVPMYSGGTQVAGSSQTSTQSRQPVMNTRKPKNRARNKKQAGTAKTRTNKTRGKNTGVKTVQKKVTRTPKSRK